MIDLDLLARYGPRLLQGLAVTLELVVLSFLAGMALAALIARARLSRRRAVRAAALGYVWTVRGTPLLAQLFLVYYGAGEFREPLEAAGLWPVFRDPFACALVVFTLNTAGYQAEIMRGALLSVPDGQREAARALGLESWPTLSRVILPQAALLALRPMGNELVLLVKGSAVASLITVFDLMGATRLAFARSFDAEVYLWAAILYLALVEVIRRLWDRLERRLTRHLPAT